MEVFFYLMLFLVIFGCVLAFAAFVGGFFLWLVCRIFDEALQSTLRARADSDGPDSARALKTTDAGPYTAPGVPTAPNDAEPPAKDHPPSATISLLYSKACGISGCVFLALAIAHVCLIALFPGPGDPYSPKASYYWIAPPVMIALATTIHTGMLETTPLRGLIITLMLLVPWGAIGIAVGIVCYRP